MSLYGCQLWSLESLDSIYTTWRMCLRKLLNVPPRTHSRYLPLIINDTPFLHQITKRVSKFAWRIISHTNNLVKTCATLCFNGSNSLFSSNISFLSDFFNCTRLTFYHSLSEEFHIPSFPHIPNENDTLICSTIKECLNILYGTLQITNNEFTHTDLLLFMSSLCTE